MRCIACNAITDHDYCHACSTPLTEQQSTFYALDNVEDGLTTPPPPPEDVLDEDE